MKKLALILILVVVGLGLSAQYQVINNGESGLSVRTKMNEMHSELYDLSLTTQYASGIPFWHDDYISGDTYIRFSSDLGVTWTTPIYMFDGDNLQNELNVNGYTITGLPTPINPTEAANKAYVDGKSSGVDSITYSDDLYLRVYLGGSVVDSALINASKSVYSITLPAGASVAARVAAAVEGVNYPSGWVLTADGLNLIVTHGENRWTANVTVKVNTSGTIRQQLLNTAAYSYYSDLSSNETKIYSLATVNKPIIIYLIFE